MEWLISFGIAGAVVGYYSLMWWIIRKIPSESFIGRMKPSKEDIEEARVIKLMIWVVSPTWVPLFCVLFGVAYVGWFLANQLFKEEG